MKIYPGSVRHEHIILEKQGPSRRGQWKLIEKKGRAQGMSVTFFKVLPVAYHLQVRHLRR